MREEVWVPCNWTNPKTGEIVTRVRVRCTAYEKLVLLKDFKPHPKNRNDHSKEQIERLAEIFNYQGVRRPIHNSTLSGCITAGHGRLLTAKHMKMESYPAEWQDYDDADQEQIDVTSDNSIALWAELDLAGINADLAELGPIDIDLLGIKDFTVDVSEHDGDGDPDAVPETPKEAKSKPGELWLLGKHRLLCGDSTKREDVDRLMAGEKPDCAYLDPPYGQLKIFSGGKVGNFSGSVRLAKQKEYGEYTGHIDFNREAFILSAKSLDAKYIVVWGGNFFADLLPIRNSWLVWNKKAGERNMYSDFELAWSTLPIVGRSFEYVWQGMIRAGEKEERVHPTQKPVALHEWALGLVTKERDPDGIVTVVDLTLGSGSTLIACEKTNRKCYGMEIDPLYCDVILSRFAKFSGKDPVREDGAKWSEVKAES